MVKTVLKLSLFCLALVLTATVALAQTEAIGPNSASDSNPGFEEPAAGKITDGFLEMYPWQDAGTIYTDSGVEAENPHSGTYRAYEDTGDGGAYQISGYQMVLGDQITLSWWALATSTPVATNPPVQDVGLISAVTTADAFNICTPLAVTTNALTGSWVQYTINYTAQAADVGNYVGCYFYTTNDSAAGGATNTYAGYDDFLLEVLPAGSQPGIVTEPASQTAYEAASATFTVSALGATSYQWMEGVTGSGVYTNLINGGQFSGVTTPSLTITNLTLTNNGDYVVVVANSSGSVTSAPPANLTVLQLLYLQTFAMTNATVPDVTPNSYTTNESITVDGWVDDLTGPDGDARLFNLGNTNNPPDGAVYSFNGTVEAFYTTCSLENGYVNTPQLNNMPLPKIAVATATNLTFFADIQSQYNPANASDFFAVQMNGGTNWYVNVNPLPTPTITWATYSQPFDPAAANWDQLALSGNGSVGNANFPAIGNTATSDLSGYITGVGIVCVKNGLATHNFDNFLIAGTVPFTTLPVINAAPAGQTNNSGTTATFTVSAGTNGSVAGLTYQWLARPTGNGNFTSLNNGGQYSGATSYSLSVSNVTSTNNQDFIVIVSDGAGSVTSAPPATLTVLGSPPTVTTNTTITPNTVYVGNNNLVQLAASFTGSAPLYLQWLISRNSNGSGAVNVPGATNSTLTLSNLQVNNSGYYSLQASNSLSVSNSSWVQLTVLPSSGAVYQWSVPVPFGNLTAAQILNGPVGTYFEAEAIRTKMVTNGSTVIYFDKTGASCLISDYEGTSGNFFYGDTGDTNLNTVIGYVAYDSYNTPPAHQITINNLTVGQAYSVQLFGVDGRTPENLRTSSYQDPNNSNDVSATFTMGGYDYVVGTFVATNASMTIQQNLQLNPGGGSASGNFSCVIVRQVTLTPTLSIQQVGLSLQVNYANGILLQATSLTGPWTTNNTASPYTFTPTGASMFFRAQAP